VAGVSFQEIIKQPRLRWTVGILMVIAAIGILLASHFYFASYNYPISKMSPQAGQTLVYGGLAIAVALFTLMWPGAGGVIAILYGILKITEYWGMHPPRLNFIPDPLYYVLYGLFLLCGIVSFTIGLNQRKTERHDDFYRDIRLIARLTALVPIGIVFIAYFFIYPPVVLYTIPAIFLVIIAWVWPLPGAVLMLMICFIGFYALFEVGWEISWKWPLFLLLGVFFVSSIFHFVLAWYQRQE
jgi:hypothetical protein